jgi:hypothetical protein
MTAVNSSQRDVRGLVGKRPTGGSPGKRHTYGFPRLIHSVKDNAIP